MKRASSRVTAIGRSEGQDGAAGRTSQSEAARPGEAVPFAAPMSEDKV